MGRPPRPHERILDSGSLIEMLGPVIIISPAGPMLIAPINLIISLANELHFAADCDPIGGDVLINFSFLEA